MKNIIFTFLICLLTSTVFSQHFLATLESNEDTLIFKINPTGNTINTTWSDIEFFVRWPDGSPPFTFGNIIVNNTNFPGVSIPNIGMNAQGSEIGFTNNWFGTSFSATPSQTYNLGTEYWVFKVVVNGPTQAADVAFELVHNNTFAPFYLALTDGLGNDLTAPGADLKFFGTNAQICGPVNCPASTLGSNHTIALAAPLPVELLSFDLYKVDEKNALLEWVTATEIQSSHFEVERSMDARTWEYIISKDAAGASFEEQHYQFLDENIPHQTLGEKLIYYRIKMVDIDGSFEYSDIRYLEFESSAVTLNLFPNPTTDGIFVRMEGGEYFKKTGLYLYDAIGQIILQENAIPLKVGVPYYLNLKQIGVSNGTYILQIFGDNEHLLTERIIVDQL